ncbi:hypothetical protein BAE44_0009383, partial [Dichanthelium oligosanthes]
LHASFLMETLSALWMQTCVVVSTWRKLKGFARLHVGVLIGPQWSSPFDFSPGYSTPRAEKERTSSPASIQPIPPLCALSAALRGGGLC